MAENSKIEWTDRTFNPWIGCTKVGPGCDNCYAENMMDHRYGRVKWGAGNPRQRTSGANWRKPLAWDRAAAAMKRVSPSSRRPRVFCASLADVFDNGVPDDWREDLWSLIAKTPNLDWLLLTKRIGNVERMAPYAWREFGWLDNVWLGITVVNQEEADRDIPKLRDLPAAVRFLSCEPLLGPIDLKYPTFNGADSFGSLQGLHWVIAGGESGPGARPMHPDWARSLRDQCYAAGVPFLFKQWGEWAPNCLCGTKEAHPDIPRPEPGHMGVMFRCGKKNAGRKLFGRTWDEFPLPTERVNV